MEINILQICNTYNAENACINGMWQLSFRSKMKFYNKNMRDKSAYVLTSMQNVLNNEKSIL